MWERETCWAEGGLGIGKSWALLGVRPALCECLHLGWAEDVGDGDIRLTVSPKQATGLPGLAMFVAALECFQVVPQCMGNDI